MNNNELYCQQKIASPGSACYYSMLALSNWQRPRVAALLAYSAEIQAVCLECRDNDVARAKLNFWYEELLAFSRGRATHPVTLQLQNLFVRQPLAYESLLSILYEAQIRLHTTRILVSDDAGHLERYHSIWRLLSIHILADDAICAGLQDFFTPLACFMGRVHILEKFFQYTQRNFHYFASLPEDMELKHLAQNLQFSEELYEFLLETMQLFTQVTTALPQTHRGQQRFMMILLQLLQLRLQRLAANGPEKIIKNLQQGRVLPALSPISNYYHARRFFKRELRAVG